MFLLFLYCEAERTVFDLHEGNGHLYLLYIQASFSQVSACYYLSQCLMTSWILSAQTLLLFSRKQAEVFESAGYKYFNMIWNHHLDLFQVLLFHSLLSFTLQTHWYIRLLSFLPHPPSLPPPPLPSVSGQLSLCGARVVAVGGLWQCVAIRLEFLSRGCGRTWSLGAGGALE